VDVFYNFNTTVDLYLLVPNRNAQSNAIGEYSVSYGASINWTSIVNIVIEIGKAVGN
jgi:hypothetical protein